MMTSSVLRAHAAIGYGLPDYRRAGDYIDKTDYLKSLTILKGLSDNWFTLSVKFQYFVAVLHCHKSVRFNSTIRKMWMMSLSRTNRRWSFSWSTIVESPHHLRNHACIQNKFRLLAESADLSMEVSAMFCNSWKGQGLITEISCSKTNIGLNATRLKNLEACFLL